MQNQRLQANRVILKMPFKNNYGYWFVTDLMLDDFRKQFAAIEISRENFVEGEEIIIKTTAKSVSRNNSWFYLSKREITQTKICIYLQLTIKLSLRRDKFRNVIL